MGIAANSATLQGEDSAGVYASVARGCADDLPPCVRSFHFSAASIRGRGTVEVRHGRRRLSRALARMLRFPPESEAAALDIVIIRRAGREEWSRSFGGRSLRSTQYARGGFLEERFGVFELRFAVDAVGPALALRSVGAAIHLAGLRIPIPRWLRPRIDARATESTVGAGIHISVAVYVPVAGLVLAYDGTVEGG